MRTQTQSSASLNHLIALVEQEEALLRKSIARKTLTHRGRYKNLLANKTFFDDNGFTKQSSYLEFDLEIIAKTIGKRNLKKGDQL